mgnify:CR=1 FL=1
MENLCQWLDINWHDSLIESTLMGKIWLGNAQEDKGNITYKLSWFHPNGIIERKDTKSLALAYTSCLGKTFFLINFLYFFLFFIRSLE